MSDRSVMLLDHDQLFSAALATLLEEEGYAVDGPFMSLRLALAELDGGAEPDLILIDPEALAPHGVSPPDRREVLRGLRGAAPHAAVIVLTGDQAGDAVSASLEAEARAHLTKGMSFTALARALQLVLLGQSVYPDRAIPLLNDPPRKVPPTGGAADLSRRETQILGCLLSGLSNKEIARRLEITESTVKMHFKNVLRKIRAANRTQAAVWALEHDIAPFA